MSDKAAKFTLALRRLCREHGVSLSVNPDERLEVWDLRQGEDPIESQIEDRTQ